MNEELNFQISEIKIYYDDLENLNLKSKKLFLENREKKLASSMALFNILNASIEIGEIIISEKNLEIPLKYKEIFSILKNNKIISIKVSKILSNYVYHRNMLAHNYGKIKFEQLYDLIENKDIFIEYINEIKSYILK